MLSSLTAERNISLPINPLFPSTSRNLWNHRQRSFLRKHLLSFGTQTGAFCSLDTFRNLWKPHYIKINEWIHRNTNWKTFKHSCGAVSSFITEFIECGFDIINPVQLSAKGMDGKKLKREYGKDITFWGGGIDTQQTLPFGTPDEVKKQVLERCEIFAKDGGFVFNAIHNIQAKTPISNIVAVIEAVKEFNGV